ncbi:hypothetical protein CABS01_04346 [Colletotrichum abscissum]|uniref:Pt repeat family protein n=1 Tax=Colletotrichum abscissum TaxID=1671311 RepID=A0A9P9XLT2_9PEZI|nr:uncharacterized protein CABS01_04346 [Colletotrichum abscissum]KAI3556214.1 hypothetical protein CABS02_03497 [Colletotrichum abscissum]KAK1473684.1 hypothetical protein CABS01_04346 [Colletotrichum abscissum]
MAESDLVRPSTSHSGASGFQRRFLLSSPGRPRTATGLNDPKLNTPSPAGGLAIRVCIKFQPSLDLTYERQYQSSYGFEPTDQLCQALIRRLTHCSHELLTRRDSTALERTIPQIGEGKPLRFELTYQIYRGGPEPWATKTFSSYQKYPMDKPFAMEIARSTDRIIGSFMKLHDKSFRWTQGRTRERSSSELEILKPLSNPVSLLHVPQSRFIDATQDWEFVPGYEITLSFRSRCKSRRQREWQRTITLKSMQSSPLTLSHGEDMAWVLSTAMQRALDARKMAFDRHHRQSRDRFDFLDESHHSEQNAVHVGFQIRNQLGLDHKHLRRELDSNLLLFEHPEGLDCDQFLSQLQHAFEAVRDDTDKELNEMDDLRVTVYELSGRGWKTEKPFAVCLDSTACYSRRTVKAILDRVQTGVADILGGNDISITLMVHKRGHLVLDKTLVARSPYYATGQRQDEDPETVKENFLSKLKSRIQSDIALVVKDTCALYDSQPQNIRVVERPVPAANDPAEMEALPSSSPLPIPTPNGAVPDSFDGSFTESSEPSILEDETLQNSSGVETMAGSVNDTVGPSQQPETPAKAIASRDQLDCSGSSLSFSMTEDGETTYPSSSSTPSLADDNIGTPHDSLLITPTFMRTLSGTPQQFDADPNIAGSETSDSDLVDDSLVGPPTPTMQRFNGPRQFSLLGKGSRSVSRQSLVSTDSGSEQRSLTDSEPSPSPESEDVIVQVEEVAESEPKVQSAAACLPVSPAAEVDEPSEEPALEGWLEYCCEPVDADEQSVAPESEALLEAEVQNAEESISQQQPVIVITPDVPRARPSTPPRSFEGFLEYSIETIVEEDEDDSDAEFHDADSTSAFAIMSSPSSFATATETGLNSPVNFDNGPLSPLILDSATASPNRVDSASPSLDLEKGALPPAVEVMESGSLFEDVPSALASTIQVDSCTSSTDTIEPTTAPHIPEAIEPLLPKATEDSPPEVAEDPSIPETHEPAVPDVPPAPEAIELSAVPLEPVEPTLDSSEQIHRDSQPPVLTEAQSVSDEAPRTPTSDSAPSFSDKEETREPSTPPLMTETEDSDYSEPSEPTVPFPEFSSDATVHDETMSLSHWSPQRRSYHFDDSSDSYFGHMRKMSIPRPLFARPSSSYASFGGSFGHKRQFSSPTAGFFGLQEPRRLDIGLRGALVGIRALQSQGKLERRPSQVLLTLDNDKGMVLVPGNSRRNSESRGIGGAGVLGLGNAFAF